MSPIGHRSAAGATTRSVLRHVRDFLFPQQCIACGRFGEPLCPACADAMPVVDREASCFRCRALLGVGLCSRCDAWDALASAFPAFYHEGAARAAVHALKYARLRALTPLMAAQIAARAGAPAVDAACPVPLHPARWRRRGFNQAELLQRSLGLPDLPGRLRRVRDTRSQVGLDRSQRQKNIAGAFTYDGPLLDGRSVCIVDDVITTGATVNECARVLREHGAGAVFAVSFTVRKHGAPAISDPIDD